MNIESYKGGYDRNLSYLIVCDEDAVIVDPFENVQQYFDDAENHDANIIGFMNTHAHFDHIQGNQALEDKGIENKSGESFDIGTETVDVIKTPGHSIDSKCYVIGNSLFSGDTLFVGKVGGTSDEESARQEWKSLQNLMDLPDDIQVYPGHDFGEKQVSTIGEEKKNNPFLQRDSFEAFYELKQNWQSYKEKHGID